MSTFAWESLERFECKFSAYNIRKIPRLVRYTVLYLLNVFIVAFNLNVISGN